MSKREGKITGLVGCGAEHGGCPNYPIFDHIVRQDWQLKYGIGIILSDFTCALEVGPLSTSYILNPGNTIRYDPVQMCLSTPPFETLVQHKN